MGVRERRHHAAKQVRHLGGHEDAALHASQKLTQGHAIDVLHNQVGILPVPLEVVDRDDVGVAEHARGTRLGKRLVDGRCHGARPVVREERHALDGHAPLEPGVPAHCHAAKAARRPLLEDAISPKQGGVAGVFLLLGDARPSHGNARRRWPVAHVVSSASCGLLDRAYIWVHSTRMPSKKVCVGHCTPNGRRCTITNARGRGGIGRRVRFRSV